VLLQQQNSIRPYYPAPTSGLRVSYAGIFQLRGPQSVHPRARRHPAGNEATHRAGDADLCRDRRVIATLFDPRCHPARHSGEPASRREGLRRRHHRPGPGSDAPTKNRPTILFLNRILANHDQPHVLSPSRWPRAGRHQTTHRHPGLAFVDLTRSASIAERS
jgi:hypothetical protein